MDQISFELGKELKDRGFPQNSPTAKGEYAFFDDERVYLPTLSEVKEELGKIGRDPRKGLLQFSEEVNGMRIFYMGYDSHQGKGSNQLEAACNLYLMLK